MSWILILYFTCAVGCGGPAPVTKPGGFYATQRDCMVAGNMSVKPNVGSLACNYVGPKYRSRREEDQE